MPSGNTKYHLQDGHADICLYSCYLGYMRSSDLLEACEFLAAQMFFALSKAMLCTQCAANCLGQHFLQPAAPTEPTCLSRESWANA